MLVVLTCIPSILEVGTGGSQVWDQPGLCRKTVSIPCTLPTLPRFPSQSTKENRCLTPDSPFWWFRANGWKFFAYCKASRWFVVPPINKLMKYSRCSLNSKELFWAMSISRFDTAHLKQERNQGCEQGVLKTGWHLACEKGVWSAILWEAIVTSTIRRCKHKGKHTKLENNTSLMRFYSKNSSGMKKPHSGVWVLRDTPRLLRATLLPIKSAYWQMNQNS